MSRVKLCVAALALAAVVPAGPALAADEAWTLKAATGRIAFHPEMSQSLGIRVDVNAPAGTPVRAAADGLVVYAGDGIDGFGNFIVIVHPNGWGTSYAHNSEMQVVVGQQVHRGEPDVMPRAVVLRARIT